MRRGRSDVSRFDTRRVLCKQHQSHCVNAGLSPRKQSCSPSMRTQTRNPNQQGQHLQTKAQWANCSLTFGAWDKASRFINPRAIRLRRIGSSDLVVGMLPFKSRAGGLATLAMEPPRSRSGQAIHTLARSANQATAMQICSSWSGWITRSQAFTIPLGSLCLGHQTFPNQSTSVARLEFGPRSKTLTRCLDDIKRAACSLNKEARFMFLLRHDKGISLNQGARGGHDRQKLGHSFLRMVEINKYQTKSVSISPFDNETRKIYL